MDEHTARIAVRETPGIDCTLGDQDLGKQALEWTDIGRLSLSSERIEDGVASTYPLDLLPRLEDLVARENNCCGSWLQCAASRQSPVSPASR